MPLSDSSHEVPAAPKDGRSHADSDVLVQSLSSMATRTVLAELARNFAA